MSEGKSLQAFSQPSELLREAIRIVEAVLFASHEPLSLKQLRLYINEDLDIHDVMEHIHRDYSARGVNLTKVDDGYAFRTASDLGFLLRSEREVTKKLSKAALETLAIIAYHQPVTRTEIEEIRGVAMSRGTLDLLMEADFVKPGRRRETPGRPLTYVTTVSFLDHFGLERLADLPGLKELKEAGLLENLAQNISVQEELALTQQKDQDDN